MPDKHRLLIPGVIIMFCITISSVSVSPKPYSSRMNDSATFTEKLYDQGILFYSTGNEPFWSLRINRDSTISFDLLGEDKLNFTGYSSSKAMDANVMRVDSRTESASLSARIMESKCTDNMSGKESPYDVEITIRRGNGGEKTFSGCGMYVPDFRLSGKWILKKIGAENIDEAAYGERIPFLEFNMADLKVSGVAGCNRVFGPVRNEGSYLRLGNLASTLMACPDNMRESDIIKGLQSSTQYIVQENELILSNPNGELLTYHRPVPEGEIVESESKVYMLNDIWVLEEIESVKVSAEDFMKRVPYLEFHLRDMKYFGNSGCNNLFGNFEAANETIKIGPAAMTKMLCPGEFEQKFIAALNLIDGWKVENLKLHLYSGGKELLKFRKTD